MRNAAGRSPLEDSRLRAKVRIAELFQAVAMNSPQRDDGTASVFIDAGGPE